ncbi:MAG: hypothetical protein HN423_02045 [Alphaproteobacteria bacterium]|nr:hypothetical protein [Alphaproteobacteria bacterium]
MLIVALAIAGILAWAFGGRTDYPIVGEVGELQVAFADPEWGGDALPEGMWCDRYDGSNARSPSLLVAGVPIDANAIVVNFNDEMVFFLDEGGGHGAIGFWVQPAAEIRLPSVPPNTRELGAEIFVEHGPLIPFGIMGRGYLPPCSGGMGNLYSAEVLAVFKSEDDPSENRLLARGYIALGRY